MQTRLDIILETVSQILESNRARRKHTKTEKTLAHFDLVAKGVPEDKIPYIGARSQRIPRKRRVSPPASTKPDTRTWDQIQIAHGGLP